jgi:hypothetical protein
MCSVCVVFRSVIEFEVKVDEYSGRKNKLDLTEKKERKKRELSSCINSWVFEGFYFF